MYEASLSRYPPDTASALTMTKLAASARPDDFVFQIIAHATRIHGLVFATGTEPYNRCFAMREKALV